MRVSGAQLPKILFWPLALGAVFAAESLRAEAPLAVDHDVYFRCDFSGQRPDPCHGPWSEPEDSRYVPMDRLIHQVAWNEGLRLTFDLLISSKNPKDQLAIARVLGPRAGTRICLAEGGPSFAKESFDYLRCRQGVDLDTGKFLDGPEGDLYLDGIHFPYLTSPKIMAPHGVRVWGEAGFAWNDELEYRPNRPERELLVRSRTGGLYRLTIVDHTPTASPDRGTYAVMGLTFTYQKVGR